MKTVEKAVNAGVSLYPSEIANFRARAALRDKGSLTGYFRRLGEAEASHQPISHSVAPDVLVKLAQLYTGYLAPALERQLSQSHTDQPHLVAEMLKQLTDALSHGARPEQLAIVPRWSLPPNHPLHQPMRRATAGEYPIYYDDGNRPHTLNEPAAPAPKSTDAKLATDVATARSLLIASEKAAQAAKMEQH